MLKLFDTGIEGDRDKRKERKRERGKEGNREAQ